MKSAIKRILVTAGPTRESIDPVRYLSNQSTGEMGYSFARAACQRGYKVTLISGPVGLDAPTGVKRVNVVSAADLRRACRKYFKTHDVLVMAAAVCDFRPVKKFRQKIKRVGKLRLELEKTSDILAEISRIKKNKLVVGFCLETEHWLERAKQKLLKKKLDGIVANRLSAGHSPFGRVKAQMAFIDGVSPAVVLKPRSKALLAKALLKWLEQLHSQKAIQKK